MAQVESGQVEVGERSRVREAGLNVGAVVGLICIVAAALSLFLGIKPLVFRSGSMSPAASTGALALAKPVDADALSVGDIVSVVDARGVRITHRVTGLEPGDDGTVSMTMRGDANAADDPSPYVIDQADRVMFHVNGLGYVVAWLSHPAAIFLGGMLAGGLGVIAFGRTRTSESDQPDTGDRPATGGAETREMEEARHG